MERIFCLLIGYICGMFQTAYLYGKMHGIDIRQHGSGNAGTTNSLRVLGKKAGVIVLLGDLFKCVLAIVLARVLFGRNNPEMSYLYAIYGGAGAVLGHNFPFFLKFKGGKGIAASAGMVLSFHGLLAVVIAPLFLVVFFVSHYVSLASLTAYLAFFIELVITGQMGIYGMSQAHLNEMYVIAFLLTIMAFYRHRENIKRLLHGEERKTYLTKKNQV